MARYKVLSPSFINNTLYEAGAETDYEGTPAGNLEPLDKAATKASGTDTKAEDAIRMQAAINGADPNTGELPTV